jgi:single-strand DNA-binding protein
MASYNRVMLMGNVTRDIELRHTPGGTAVTDMGMAVNDRRKNTQGEWVDETTFVEVTLWGRTAEIAAEFLKKGSPVFIEGKLRLDSWEADGQKKYKLKVVGDRLQLLGSKGDGSGRAEYQQPSNFGGATGAARQNREEYHELGPGDGPTQHEYSATGRREAQPSGEGDGYEDPDIPF